MSNISFLFKNLNNSIKVNLSSTWGLNLSKPLQVSIMPNRRCNARCLMCTCWEEKNDYLDSNDIIKSLKELRKWLGRNFFVQISGGEPLIFKGIYDIFSFCEDNDIICKISTNGISLTEKTCDKIIQSKLRFLSVSLDSHLPEIHDKFRGVEKTFERALKGINYLAKNGNLTLGISTIIMRDNISTLCDSVDFFLKLPIHRLLFQPIGIWTADIPVEKWPEFEYWIKDKDALNKFEEYLLLKKKEDTRIMNTERDIKEWSVYFNDPNSQLDYNVKKCNVGYDRISIDYKGDIQIGCGILGNSGNIKQDNLKDAWNSSSSKKMRQEMMNCTYPCAYNCYKTMTLQEKIKKVQVFIKSGLFESKQKQE
jgi:MoaA/NifB/PqqE/SkfB family radical SAM enzyme